MTYSLPIETDRLTLRRYRDSDYGDLLELHSNDDVARFLLYDARTPEQVKKSLADRLADVAMDTDGQALTLAVVLTGAGQHLGEVTLLERLGMRREAHFVRNEFLKGEWTDELVYALLADEWAAKK